jgi:hypothetical protein
MELRFELPEVWVAQLKIGHQRSPTATYGWYPAGVLLICPENKDEHVWYEKIWHPLKSTSVCSLCFSLWKLVCIGIVLGVNPACLDNSALPRRRRDKNRSIHGAKAFYAECKVDIFGNVTVSFSMFFAATSCHDTGPVLNSSPAPKNFRQSFGSVGSPMNMAPGGCFHGFQAAGCHRWRHQAHQIVQQVAGSKCVMDGWRHGILHRVLLLEFRRS